MKVSFSLMLLILNLSIYAYIIRLVPICESDKIKGPPLATYFNNNIKKEVTSVNGSKGYALNRKDCMPVSMNNNQAMSIVDVNCKVNCDNSTVLNSNDIILSNIKQNAVSTKNSNAKQNASIVTTQPKTYVKQAQGTSNQPANSNVSVVAQSSNKNYFSGNANLKKTSSPQSQVVNKVVSQISPKIVTITQAKPQVFTRVIPQPQQKISPVSESKQQVNAKLVSRSQPSIITVTRSLSQNDLQLQPKVISLTHSKPQVVTRMFPPSQPHPQIISKLVRPTPPKIITIAKPQATLQPQLRFITVTRSIPQVHVQTPPKMITITRSKPQITVKPQPRFITVTAAQSQDTAQQDQQRITLTRAKPQITVKPQPRFITVTAVRSQDVAQQDQQMITIIPSQHQATVQPEQQMTTITASQARMSNISQQKPQIIIQPQQKMITLTQPHISTQYIQPTRPEVASGVQSSAPVKYSESAQKQEQNYANNNISTSNQMQVVQPMSQQQIIPVQQTIPRQIPSPVPVFLYPQNNEIQSSGGYYNFKNIDEQHFISLEYLCNMNISPEIPQCINYRIPTPIINIQALPRIVMPRKVLPKVIKNKGIHDFELLKLMNGISLMELRKINKNIKRIYTYIKNTNAVEDVNKVTRSPYTINSNNDEIACSFNPQISGSEGKEANICYKMLCVGDDCNNDQGATVANASDTQMYSECENNGSNAPCMVVEGNEKEVREENVVQQEGGNNAEENVETISQNENDRQITADNEQIYQKQNISPETTQTRLGIIDVSSADATEAKNQQENLVIADSNDETAQTNVVEKKIPEPLEKQNTERSHDISTSSNGLRSDINIGNLRENDEIIIKSEIKIGQKTRNNAYSNKGSDVVAEEKTNENLLDSESSKQFFVKGFSRGRRVDLSDNKNKIESSSIHYMKSDEGNRKDESNIVYQVESNHEESPQTMLNTNLIDHQQSYIDTTDTKNNYSDSKLQELYNEWERKNTYQKLKKEEFNLRVYRLLAKLKDGEYCKNEKDKEICLGLYSNLIKNSYEDGEFHEILPIHEDVDTERYRDIFEDNTDELILKSILSHKIYKEMMFRRLRDQASDSSSNNSFDDGTSASYTGTNKSCDYSNGYLNTADCIKVMRMSDLIKGGGYDENCSRSLYQKLRNSFDKTYCSTVGSSYDMNGENKYFYLSDFLQ